MEITILRFHQAGKNGASILANWCGALPRGHTSFWATPRRLHTTHVNSTQRPTTYTVSARAGPTPICSIRHPNPLSAVPDIPGGRRVDRDRMGAGSSQRTDAGKVLGGPVCGHGRRGRGGGGRVGRLSAERAASESKHQAAAHTGG